MNLFELFACPVFLLVSFLTVYVILHYLYIRKPLDEVGWKKADYWWLLIAAFGLFPAIHSLWVDVEKDQISILKSIEKNSASVFSNQLALLSDSSACSVKSNVEETKVDALKPSIQRTCGYFRRSLIPQADDRNYYPSSEQLDADLAALKSGADAVFLSRLERVKIAAKRYWDNTKDTDALPKASDSLFYKTYLALGPLLLVVALAIRLAKVTGEILLKRPDAFKFWRVKKTLVLRINEAIDDPQGIVTLKDGSVVAKKIKDLTDAAADAKFPVTQVFHWPANRTDGVYFAADRTVIPNVEMFEMDVRKLLFNTKLHGFMKSQGIKEVIICGALAQSGVEMLARTLKQLGYDVIIAADACFDMNVLQAVGERSIESGIAPHVLAQLKAFDIELQDTDSLCKAMKGVD